MLRVSQLTGFGGGGDHVQPQILSTNSTTVDGGQHLSFSIVTDKPCTLAIGGTDAPTVQLASNAEATTHTLQWAGDTTRTHASPADANGDNEYDVTVTPTSVSGIVGATQNLTITVGLDWVDAFSQSMSSDGTGWGGVTLRPLFNSSVLSSSGSQVRLVLQAASTTGFTIDKLYIGQQATSGDPYDMLASGPAPAQFLVGGSGLMTCGPGGTITTDALSFSLDHTKNHVIAAHFSAASDIKSTNGVSGVTRYSKIGISEADVADATTGYDTVASQLNLIYKIQVAP